MFSLFLVTLEISLIVGKMASPVNLIVRLEHIYKLFSWCVHHWNIVL